MKSFVLLEYKDMHEFLDGFVKVSAYVGILMYAHMTTKLYLIGHVCI